MPKVLVLKAPRRHVQKKFLRFLAEIWPEKITSRDGCVLLKQVQMFLGIPSAVSSRNVQTRQKTSYDSRTGWAPIRSTPTPWSGPF